MELQKINEIANITRNMFENNNINEAELSKLYLKYNQISNIDSFVKRAGNMFPKLNCGLASVYLKKAIGKGKIINGKYLNNNHTFLLVDKNVVDITSDQYGGPKVYSGQLQYPWKIKK